MRAFWIMILLLASVIPAAAQGPAGVTHRPRKHLYFSMATSTTECVVGIVLSKNPYTAAAIGLPILFGGNIVGAKLYNKHPRWAGFIQNMSGLGCLAGALTRHAPKSSIHPATATTTPTTTPVNPPTHPVKSPVKIAPPGDTTPPVNPPTGGTGVGSGSGNPGAGSGSGSAGSGSGSSGSGAGSGGSGAGSGSGSAGSGSGGSGSGSGGSGSGSGGSGSGGSGGSNPPPPPSPPPTHGPCIQDCGIPGNGGVNGGQDIKKPPFPGKGPVHHKLVGILEQLAGI